MARQKAQAKPPRVKQSTISASMRKKASDAVAHAASDVTYVPGFYKIVDEILVNAADNKVSSQNLCIVCGC